MKILQRYAEANCILPRVEPYNQIQKFNREQKSLTPEIISTLTDTSYDMYIPCCIVFAEILNIYNNV